MAVKHAILGLLHFRDMHGYRIKELLESNFGHLWSVNFGQIYPALSDMREQGLVEMHEEAQDNAPARRVYAITPEGRGEFQRWLAASPQRGQVLRDPFLLRLAFFNFGDPDRALELIDEQIASYERQLDHRQDNADKRANADVYSRLLIDLGLDLNNMMLDWLRRAKKEIMETTAVAKT